MTREKETETKEEEETGEEKALEGKEGKEGVEGVLRYPHTPLDTPRPPYNQSLSTAR